MKAKGIQKVSRDVVLWNSKTMNLEVDLSERLASDSVLMKKITVKNSFKNDAIRCPAPRAFHSMSFIGKPFHYLVIFGGYMMDDQEDKKFLNDFWVFNLNKREWQ